MRIGSGFNPYLDMSSHVTRKIPEVSIDEVKKQNAGLKSDDMLQSPASDTQPESQREDHRSRMANLEDVSLSLQKQDDFEYIGRDSEINLLDMQKAISDMQKDSVLEEYQYFVGSSQGFGMMNTEDGTVIAKASQAS